MSTLLGKMEDFGEWLEYSGTGMVIMCILWVLSMMFVGAWFVVLGTSMSGTLPVTPFMDLGLGAVGGPVFVAVISGYLHMTESWVL